MPNYFQNNLVIDDDADDAGDADDTGDDDADDAGDHLSLWKGLPPQCSASYRRAHNFSSFLPQPDFFASTDFFLP